MGRLSKLINRTLSFRLTLRVIFALAILLIAALLVMFWFSRKAVKEETGSLLDVSSRLSVILKALKTPQLPHK